MRWSRVDHAGAAARFCKVDHGHAYTCQTGRVAWHALIRAARPLGTALAPIRPVLALPLQPGLLASTLLPLLMLAPFVPSLVPPQAAAALLLLVALPLHPARVLVPPGLCNRRGKRQRQHKHGKQQATATEQYLSGEGRGSVGWLPLGWRFAGPCLGKCRDIVGKRLDVDGSGIKGLADPVSHLGVVFVCWVGEGVQELVIAPGTIDIFGRAASGGVDQNRIGKAGYRVGDALDLDRVVPSRRRSRRDT